MSCALLTIIKGSNPVSATNEIKASRVFALGAF